MTAQHLVTVRHNFETAHRLPVLGGKCANLHGHSWWAEVTLTGPKNRTGVVTEFGTVKGRLREWIDVHLDHGTMLGVGDPLAELLKAEGTKLYRFGMADRSGTPHHERMAADLYWPTVENVAGLIARVAVNVVAPDAGVSVARVKVTETHVNTAEYLP